MTARSLVVGFDGFDLSVVRALGPEVLPHVHSLMDRGAFAALKSVQPPATLPNWTSFLTGVDPGAHGVFDFTVRDGYQVKFAAGTVREAPTVISRLDRLGQVCACIGFPGTWPPEELEHGVFMSGWDSPVAFEADRSFVWPPAMYDLIRTRFGNLRFDDVNEFDADEDGWHQELPARLCDRIDRKTQLAGWLLQSRAWDLFAVYFGESDTASHYLWSLHDPDSPRRPAGHAVDAPSGLARVYGALDRALGELLQQAGQQVEVTIVSDHGSGGSSDKVVFLNRVLRDAGLLTFRKRRRRFAHVLKEFALKRFSPALRERIFRLGRSFLPSWLESQARFGCIDMTKTVAFSDELNYFPSIHLNLEGREPSGTVTTQERHQTILQIESALYSLNDPWTGRPVVRRVYRREELFRGPFVARAPDLLLELHLDAGYSYNLMPSTQGPRDGAAWRRLTEAEKLGRKGRSLPGSHRSHGFLAMAGPAVCAAGEVSAHITDATATLLARHGVKVPTETSGRVLWNTLQNPGMGDRPVLPITATTRPATRGDSTIVESRLRALGYID